MKVIWKYPIEITDSQELSIPLGAKFISAISQGDQVVLYFLVDPGEAKSQVIELRILGTGHCYNDGYLDGFRFLETIVTHGGMLVWHIFAPPFKGD